MLDALLREKSFGKVGILFYFLACFIYLFTSFVLLKLALNKVTTQIGATLNNWLTTSSEDKSPKKDIATS